MNFSENVRYFAQACNSLSGVHLMACLHASQQLSYKTKAVRKLIKSFLIDSALSRRLFAS